MSNKYQVTTIVNLLLDMDYAIDEQYLTAQDLEKGIQTMIDEDQHHKLLDTLAAYKPNQSAGGACTYAVFASACLGAKAFVNGRIGNDEAAQALKSSLTSAQIKTTDDAKLHTDGNTGKCLVLVTPDAERTMMTYLGVSSEIPESSVDLEETLNTDYFLVEGFQAIPDLSRQTNIEVIKKAHAAGARIALSLCDEAVVEYFHTQISAMIEAAPIDILFCNQFEAMKLTNTNDVTEAATALQEIARQFVMTQGAQGALVWDGEQLISISGIKAEAKDTTGAGDIFVGTFLWGITNGLSHEQAGTFANMAAAELVTHYGPRLSQEQLTSVYNNFKNQA